MGLDYKKSGVDIDAGDALVDWLQSTSTFEKKFKSNLVDGIGGFAAITRFPFLNMKKPCLVSSTDGVGTKVKLAAQYKKFDGIGHDLVGMCVNDLITCGATPFFFLDYYAVGKLDLNDAKQFLTSVRKACDLAQCGLVGGETAEMPGIYQAGDFDCAGFSVGVVDEDEIRGPKKVKVGDVVLGVESSGFHSTGFSLVRRIFEKDMDQWVDRLLTPTKIYVNLVQKLMKQIDVHAMAHITGSGVENIPRVFPENVKLHLKNWAWPDVFTETQKRADISVDSMLRTFNCGVGYVFVIAKEDVEKAKNIFKAEGYASYFLGEIESRKETDSQLYFGEKGRVN